MAFVYENVYIVKFLNYPTILIIIINIFFFFWHEYFLNVKDAFITPQTCHAFIEVIVLLYIFPPT